MGQRQEKNSAKGETRMKANQVYVPHDRINKHLKHNYDFLPTELARTKSLTIPSSLGLQSTRKPPTLLVKVQTGFTA